MTDAAGSTHSTGVPGVLSIGAGRGSCATFGLPLTGRVVGFSLPIELAFRLFDCRPARREWNLAT